jgi:hypothetical protein
MSLAIKPLRVEPKEDFAVQELIPLRGREPNEASLQRDGRYGFLVTDDQPRRQDRSLRAVLSLNGSSVAAIYPDAVEERTRAQEAVLLDGRPVLRFSQVVHKGPKIHVTLASSALEDRFSKIEVIVTMAKHGTVVKDGVTNYCAPKADANSQEGEASLPVVRIRTPQRGFPKR